MVGGEADARLEDIDVGAVNHVGGAKAVLGDPQFDSVFYVARTAELRASLEEKGGEVGVRGDCPGVKTGVEDTRRTTQVTELTGYESRRAGRVTQRLDSVQTACIAVQ